MLVEAPVRKFTKADGTTHSNHAFGSSMLVYVAEEESTDAPFSLTLCLHPNTSIRWLFETQDAHKKALDILRALP